MSTKVVLLSPDRIADNILRLAKKFEIQEIICETTFRDEDTFDVYSIKTLCDDFRNESELFVQPKQITNITTLNDFIQFLGYLLSERYPEGFNLFTPAQWEKEKEEREYRECESAAAQFASSFGLKFGTQEFLERLDEEVNNTRSSYEQENSMERRMEHWAACQYNGLGSDTFFDDMNYTNQQYHQKFENLERVWVWLKKKCPLLMAQYMEKKLQDNN